MNSLWSRTRGLVDDVAGIPPRGAYVWGGVRAPFPFAIFHLATLLRFVSPLQWVKKRFRARRARAGTNLRRDFPAAFTEYYLLVVLGIAAAAYVAEARTHVRLPTAAVVLGHAVTWLLVVECGTWIVYYLFLRSFIEGRYTAYHPAEYLLQFPVVVAAQALLVADLLDARVTDVLDALRGSGTLGGTAGAVLPLLGLVYLTGAAATLINSLPTIQSRRPEDIIVVGAGAVTRQRILAALEHAEWTHREIEVVDVREGAMVDERLTILDERKIVQLLRRRRSPVIVASPTSSHLHYVSALAGEGIPFAVEKPLCGTRGELRQLVENPQLMANGFALGYYALEKALPITYLFTLHDVYREHLDVASGELPTREEFDFLIQRLGPLRAVHSYVLEGTSRSPSGTERSWTEHPPILATLAETAVHPLQVAMRLLDDPTTLTPRSARVGRYGPRAREIWQASKQQIAPTYADIEAEATTAAGERATVRIEVGKHMPATLTRRGCRAEFQHGTIRADFDRRSAIVQVDGEDALELRVKDGANYVVQMRLFRHMLTYGWGDGRFDEYLSQVEALQAWHRICTFVGSRPVFQYDDDATSLGAAGGSASTHR
ncbi:MAG TPA: hypothetical protein VGN28_13845 [Blastococcus sp.]|nr:hypothetical protein [Blastococcus sp.]